MLKTTNQFTMLDNQPPTRWTVMFLYPLFYWFNPNQPILKLITMIHSGPWFTSCDLMSDQLGSGTPDHHHADLVLLGGGDDFHRVVQDDVHELVVTCNSTSYGRVRFRVVRNDEIKAKWYESLWSIWINHIKNWSSTLAVGLRHFYNLGIHHPKRGKTKRWIHQVVGRSQCASVIVGCQGLWRSQINWRFLSIFWETTITFQKWSTWLVNINDLGATPRNIRTNPQSMAQLLWHQMTLEPNKY